jgi:hypothetical protein
LVAIADVHTMEEAVPSKKVVFPGQVIDGALMAVYPVHHIGVAPFVAWQQSSRLPTVNLFHFIP